MWASAICVAVLAASLAACSSEPAVEIGDPWVGTIATEGDVTTVVNESRSVWDGESRLIEEATIGAGDSEEYIFAEPGGVATDGDRIYVTDRAASVVRVYDMEGQYLKDLGGQGQGPGEMASPKGIGIAGDGRILVQDNRARRIHVFDADGTYLESWHRYFRSSTWDERFTVTLEGLAYIRETTNLQDPLEDRKRGMAPYGPSGYRAVAIINITDLGFLEESVVRWGGGWGGGGAFVPFIPRAHWMMAKDTTLVFGWPDDYRFEMLHSDGKSTVVERAVQPVRVQRGEFDWAKQTIVLQARQEYPRWSWNGPGAPRHKPFFDGLYFDEAGRVWVLRELAGEAVGDCAEDSDDYWERLERPCWLQPRVFEVFSQEGKLLTTVPYSGRISRNFLPLIDGEIALIPEEDPNGNVLVRRYRWVMPQGASK